MNCKPFFALLIVFLVAQCIFRIKTRHSMDCRVSHFYLSCSTNFFTNVPVIGIGEIMGNTDFQSFPRYFTICPIYFVYTKKIPKNTKEKSKITIFKLLALKWHSWNIWISWLHSFGQVDEATLGRQRTTYHELWTFSKELGVEFFYSGFQIREGAINMFRGVLYRSRIVQS